MAVTAPPGCSWTARSGASWIKITSGGSGTGNGTVNFTVDPVTSSPRSATLTIAGKIFNVWQELNSCGAPNFKAVRRYPISINATQLVTADFNRDGKPDLAAMQALQGENYISVLLNNAMGGFNAATDIKVGGNEQDLSVGDINGDGNADLIATDLLYVQIFFGNGMGGFSKPTGIRVTPDFHYAARAADFNGDGKQDLAVSYRDPTRDEDDYVTILLGDGTGHFTRTTNFFKGGIAAVADINKDNKQDLAISPGLSTISVYLGDGSGNFGQEIVTQVNPDYANYAIRDMNGDGKPDLASSYGIQLGDKTGHFGPLLRVPSISEPLQFITVGDFNSDSKPDLAGSAPSGKFAIALGDGTGKVKAPVFYSAIGRPFNLVSADFNGDRQLDLAAATHDYGLSVLMNGCQAAPDIDISGRILDENGNSLGGYLTLSSPRIGTIIADASTGAYAFKDLEKDDVYTIVAMAGSLYEFTSRTISYPATNQIVNFKGTLKNFSIKGRLSDYSSVGIGGVTVELSGGRTATTQTDAKGNFLFQDLPARQSYTITVAPSTICSDVLGSPYTIQYLTYDQTLGFFAATRQMYGISGQVKNGSVGVGGVTVVLTSPIPAGFAPRTATTTSLGRYAFGNLPAGRNYIIKATKANYKMTPSSITYSFLGADQTTGNFTAVPTLTTSPQESTVRKILPWRP